MSVEKPFRNYFTRRHEGTDTTKGDQEMGMAPYPPNRPAFKHYSSFHLVHLSIFLQTPLALRVLADRMENETSIQ